MSASETPINSDYAQEWIRFLKRRNAILSVVWPVLLVFCITAGFAAIFYYQTVQTMQLSLDGLAEKQLNIETEKSALADELAQSQSQNAKLVGEIEQLNKTREALSVKQDDSVSKLNISSQMLENMEQQLNLLKAENQELSNQLDLAKQTMNELETMHKSDIERFSEQKAASMTELHEQLESRKTAYQALANRQQDMRAEMDRMRNLVNSKEKEVSKLQDEKKALAKDIKELQTVSKIKEAELTSLRTQNKELDNKLKALVSPIGTANTSTSKQNVQTKTPDKANKPANITGFEEIKKPATPPANSTANSLDYDQIRVLP